MKKDVNLGIISQSNTWFSGKHDKNCMVDNMENYKFDLGVKGLMYL